MHIIMFVLLCYLYFFLINNFEDKGINAIIEALKANTTITELNIYIK